MDTAPVPAPLSPPPRRRWRLGRLLLLAALSLVVLVAGGFGYYYATSRTVREATRAVLSGSLSPARTFGRTQVNLLLIGRDVDLDEHAQVVHTRGRADLLILAHLDFVDNSVHLLSIPRDTWVAVPGHGHHKVNAAHALGGPPLAVATVGDLLGVQPECYLAVSYQAVATAIDGLGGVRVAVDKPLHYDDNWGKLHIHLAPGVQHLGGVQAVGMARYRKSNSGVGDTDLQRIRRQQRLLAALRSQLKDPWVLMQVPGVIDRVRPGIETNLSPEQLASLAWFSRGLGPGAMQMATIPGEQRRTCIKPDLHAARALAQQMCGP